MNQANKYVKRTVTDLIVDSAIFIGFLVATAPRFSGLAIHEWLGIAFGAAIITHLLLHWSWIVGISKRFFSKVQGQARLNYVLNALLFIDVTIIIVTGLLISEVALPLFGLRFPRDGMWLWIHRTTSDAAVFLIGLHVALHWSWIVKTLKRLVVTPPFSRPGRTALNLTPAQAQKEPQS